MNYGFVVDNRTCIGCHACSTACKSENEVPLGINRTWVKYTEVGTYPEVRRGFQVTRCNHCENPPCASICPTSSMFKRENGIVDFDPSICIGCKACIQACPYDAIDIDPSTNSASKCNLCAHRVEQSLEPACVVVCPTHSIIAGDMEDRSTEISKTLAKHPTTVRKPEQGTAPNLFYIGGDDLSLTPTATNHQDKGYMWADTINKQTSTGYKDLDKSVQGANANGPISVAASQMVQVGYNAQHKIHWKWPVPSYFVTKGISSGIFMILATLFGFGLLKFDYSLFIKGIGSSLFFLLATVAFLVFDLKHPKRFFYMLIKPHWKSWLTKGSFILIGFSNILTFWLGLELGAKHGYLPTDNLAVIRKIIYLVGSILALFSAIYTAFLFGQAEGRDLWQSSLFPPHLFVQAIMAGTAFLTLIGTDIPLLNQIFLGALILDLLIIWAEFGMSHSSDNAVRAARDITQGTYKLHFWEGVLLLGHIIPIVLLQFENNWVLKLAGGLTIFGLYLYEHAFVMAPQKIPNS